MALKLWAVLVMLVAAAVGEERVMEEYRVPAAIEPTHYTLKVLTNLADDFSFTGEVWIDVVSKSAVDSITLNYKNLIIFENETKIEHVASSKEKRDVRVANLRRLAMRGRKKLAETSTTTTSTAAPVIEVETTVEEDPKDGVLVDDKLALRQDSVEDAVTTSSAPEPSTAAADPSTTEAHQSTTEAPLSSTAAIISTTAAPISTSAVPVSTTAAPPVSTTEPPPLLPEDPSSTTEAPSSAVPLESSPELPLEVTTEAPGMAVAAQEDPLEIVTHDFDTERQFLTMSANRALQPGDKYRIYIKFQGFLSDTLTGFYRVAYAKRNKKTSWMAATLFEPIEARAAFPCFDEPEYKATFDIVLGHSSEYTALSNMPLRATKLIGDKPGWQWDYFETTPRMSTYLVAFVISDLESLDANKARNSSEFRYWARHEVVHKARYASKIVPPMKKYLEGLLGQPDVMPKYDLVAMPSFISNALENWGLISFSEKSLLFTPGFSSILSKYETTRLLGHELAHTWFGNSLTPRWWDQIWLSEGICNFFETKAADHVQPDWDVITFSAVSSYLRVFSIDALHATHALVPQVRNPNDLNEIFDSITYQKGYYLIRMLNHTLGEEAFMDGIRAYVHDHHLGNVEEEDLWRALTAAGHAKGTLPDDLDLADVMRAWTREPGYPVLQLTRDYANLSATITQRRFLRPKEDYELRSPNGTEETRWYIPVTYTTGQEMRFSDTSPRLWLKPEQESVLLQDIANDQDYVLMNVQAAGFYRVNYDYDNWALLIDQLLSENYTQIAVINRVQILDDLLDFARAGEISYQQALDATSYLRREKHYLPWKAAFSNFEYISRMLRSTDSGRIFKKFMRNLVSERYEELGFDPKKDETLFESMNRKQIVKWACRTGQRSCTRKSVSLFKKWTEEKKPDEINPVPSNLRSVVYCSAIEQGGARDWQFLWQRYLSNSVVTDKAAIITALGCSRNTRTLRKYLDWSMKETSGVKKQDSVAVFKAVAANDVGYPLAKKFLQERLNEVPKYVGTAGRHLPQLVDALAKKMNQMKDLEELETLEQENASVLRTSPRTVRQAMDKVRFNIGWVQANLVPITDWLKRQTNT